MMRLVFIFVFVAACAVLPVFAQDDSSTSSLTINSGTVVDSGSTTDTTSSDLTTNGTGTLTLSGANTYTGGTTITGGTLIVNGNTSTTSSSGTLAGSGTVVSGATLTLSGVNTGGTTLSTGTLTTGGTLQVSGTTGDTTGAVLVLNNGGTLSTNNGVYQPIGSSTIASGGTLTLGPTNTTLLLNGVSGVTTTIANANDITGDVNISSGTLQVNNSQGLGAGTVTVLAGGTLSLNGQSAGSGTYTVVNVNNNLTINGTGVNGQGAITSAGGSGTIAGTVTLGSNASVGNSGGTNLGLGAIALSGNTLTVGTGTGIFSLNGNITGTGGLIVSGSTVGVYGGDNSFTGNTEVTSGSQLVCADYLGTAVFGNVTIEDRGSVADTVGRQFTANTVVTLNGSAQFNLSNSAQLDVLETIAGLQGTSTTSVVTAGTGAVPSFWHNVLTLAGTGTYSYAGQISDIYTGMQPGSWILPASLSIVKAGSGTQILSGANTYYGPTVVNAGVLVFTQGMSNTQSITTAAGGTLNLASGSFSTTGTIVNNGTITLGSGVKLACTGGSFTNNGTLDLRHDPTFVLPANFINNGTILYAGTQTFSSWSTTQMTNPTDQTAAAAPMKDGVPNVMKFLCDIDPTHSMSASDRAALPAFAMAQDGSLTLTFRKSPTQSGLAVNVQTSTDMVHWTTLPQSQTPSPTTCTMQQVGTDPTTNDDMVQVSVQPSGAVTQFIRLGVATP